MMADGAFPVNHLNSLGTVLVVMTDPLPPVKAKGRFIVIVTIIPTRVNENVVVENDVPPVIVAKVNPDACTNEANVLE